MILFEYGYVACRITINFQNIPREPLLNKRVDEPSFEKRSTLTIVVRWVQKSIIL